MSEQHDTQDLPLDQPKQSLRWTISLLLFSATGLLAETVQFVPPTIDASAFALVLSWVGSSRLWEYQLLISLFRPQHLFWSQSSGPDHVPS